MDVMDGFNIVLDFLFFDHSHKLTAAFPAGNHRHGHTRMYCLIWNAHVQQYGCCYNSARNSVLVAMRSESVLRSKLCCSASFAARETSDSTMR